VQITASNERTPSSHSQKDTHGHVPSRESIAPQEHAKRKESSGVRPASGLGVGFQVQSKGDGRFGTAYGRSGDW
jgi:hypothetical protein